MSKNISLVSTVGLLLGVISLSAFAEEPPPYGHKDFYPSAERPIGFRGDGNGSFPGATPVTEWWEHTPKRGDRKGHAFLRSEERRVGKEC